MICRHLNVLMASTMADGSTDEEDIGCSSVADMSETDPDTIPECADGVDNNEDGVVDFPNDPGCSARGDGRRNTTQSTPHAVTGAMMMRMD